MNSTVTEPDLETALSSKEETKMRQEQIKHYRMSAATVPKESHTDELTHAYIHKT